MSTSNEENNRRYNEQRKRDEELRAAHQKSSGGAGNSGCFPAGTMVMTPSGERDISSLEARDLVMSFNPDTGHLEARRILRKFVHATGAIWRIQFSDGIFARTTSIHSFAVGANWKRANELKPGDAITFESGDVSKRVVVSSYLSDERCQVFNILVERNFTFVADGALVHSFSYFKTWRSSWWTIRTALSRYIRSANWASPKIVDTWELV